MKQSLKAGIEHELAFRVPDNKTVPSLFPESPEFQAMPRVFATGFMVGLIEWACILAINPYIDWPDEQTVGTHVNLSHSAATPPGLEVRARVELITVDRKRLVFEVEAHDGVDLICRGSHERYVINAETFNKRAKDKLG
ncbi:MAG: thioesterase family protein [Proteobacteria bacterium]|nr:thioesterase family protein [Pseudomonadota bacterium]